MGDINWEEMEPDSEPLPSDHEFYDELASLVEKYEAEEGEPTRMRLLFACNQFGNYWLQQMEMTGDTW